MTRHAFISKYVDVLGPERKRFLDSARSSTFAPAGVIGDTKWRSASVCDPWPLMETALEMLCEAVDLQRSNVVDCQLTRSGDGDYFLPHFDNNRPGTEHRRVTFVYYLGDRETFNGGNLRFPSLGLESAPDDDTMIFFPADESHEIVKVRRRQAIPTSQPLAARYTLNGWLA